MLTKFEKAFPHCFCAKLFGRLDETSKRCFSEKLLECHKGMGKLSIQSCIIKQH